MPELELVGCRSRPLAAYLKALGVFRLVAEQREPEARGFWRDGVFVLASPLEKAELLDFFLNEYKPTPLVAPWNKGSGFHAKNIDPEKKNKLSEGINAIASSENKRLQGYREVIALIRSWPELEQLRTNKESKLLLLRGCIRLAVVIDC